jgi:signal transduction histidine kinase
VSFSKSPWRSFDKGSLQGRLIKLAAVWFIFSLIVVTVFLTSFVNYASVTRAQSGIDLIIKNLYTDLSFDDGGQFTAPPLYDRRLSMAYSGLYWQITEVDAGGKSLKQHRSLSLLNYSLKQPQRIDTSGKPNYYDSKGPLGEPLRLVYQYITYKDHRLVFVVAEDFSKVNRDVMTFALITSSALLVMVGFSLLAIFIQVRVGLKPLYALTTEVAHVRCGRQQRLLQAYPHDIEPLARQINDFLDYNQEVMERQRTHVGNLAHALKTPLTILLNQAKDDSDLSHTVKKQAGTMRDQVERHLRRARAAARSQTQGERTLVEPVIDELAVMFEQIFVDKGLTIDWRIEDGLCFRGERQDLQEIIGNLMENACLWAKKKVHIEAVSHAAKQNLSLVVQDDGPGLANDRYDEVLKRGVRFDENLPGSGLGLAIVDELVRAYKGDIHLDRAKLGGLAVCLKLPG